MKTKVWLFGILTLMCIVVSSCDNPKYTEAEILGIAKANYSYVANNPQGLFTGEPYIWRAEYKGEHEWLVQAEAQKDPEYKTGVARHLASTATEVTLSWKYYERTGVLAYEFAYFKESPD